MASSHRIGIIIHYSTTNYGNHLVNYATRNILQECGYEVDLLVLEEHGQSRLDTLKRLPRKLQRLGIKGATSRLLGRLKRLTFEKPVAASLAASVSRRRERFAVFSQSHLRSQFIDRENTSNLKDAYARVGIGSDQIWNFDYGINGSLFADFTSPKNVVTLSPSVGHERIPTEWVRSYERWLAGFTEVGTREVEWTQELASRSGAPNFTLLVDPTLMYDQDFWGKIASPSSEAQGKILLYHLGELLPQHAEYVSELADRHSLDTLHLSDTVGGAPWETNATEFLGMVQAAACVVTDSYHGAIFAFLFDKPLVLLERHGFAGSMNTRTRTLTDRLHLSDRYMNVLSIDDALNHDYTRGADALHGYRDEYWAYLRRQGIQRSRVSQPNHHE
ncbi:polysaccharide pyruvyl transferase family protein [Pseudarthrobacter oxydans]|uniref:polysaccharide pyruvyl transferase family protein n=1 Tax=Pseudarthrobacter oxydans TaxID=1671 RepID=UPI0034176A0E